tara:strand:- start:987 stop:2105 length:1119 start_codon:yes stop_codon:yes gene_type:complete
MKLVKGTPHKLNLKYYKNSAKPFRDKYPLSGNGRIYKYNFSDEAIEFSQIDISVSPKSFKGLHEKSPMPLANFANTSLFEHNKEIYAIFESKPPVNISTLYETTFDNKLCNFLNVHYEKDENNDTILFSSVGKNLIIFRIPESSNIAKTEVSIKLSQSFYIHSFVRDGDYLIFSMFPSDFDIKSMIVGMKSVIDSLVFKNNEHLQLLIYNLRTKTHNIVDIPDITSPVFHIVGTLNQLHLFATPRNFAMNNITSKYDYNSKHYILDIDTDGTVNFLLHTEFCGEMPYFYKNTLAFVENQTLHCNCMSKYFQGYIEEPAIIESSDKDLQILQIEHFQNKTFLHIIDVNTMNTESLYQLNKQTIHGFHGLISNN